MRGCVSAGMAAVLVNLGLVDTIDEVILMTRVIFGTRHAPICLHFSLPHTLCSQWCYRFMVPVQVDRIELNYITLELNELSLLIKLDPLGGLVGAYTLAEQPTRLLFPI